MHHHVLPNINPMVLIHNRLSTQYVNMVSLLKLSFAVDLNTRLSYVGVLLSFFDHLYGFEIRGHLSSYQHVLAGLLVVDAVFGVVLCVVNFEGREHFVFA